MDMDTEADLYQRIDVLEAENYSLTQQIKQLENGLDKETKFHRKFVEDVIQSEELRNLDFEKQRRELLEHNKRLVAENRQLTIDKTFYKTSYDSLMKEEDWEKTNRSHRPYPNPYHQIIQQRTNRFPCHPLVNRRNRK